MNNKNRRQTLAPCYVCLEAIDNEQDVIYCSVCGEQYHNDCWRKNDSKCRVYKCSGRTYKLWVRVEPAALSFLGVKKSSLLVNCPNCQNNVSPLSRYCNVCGYDVNRPERQNTFKYYDFAVFLRKIRLFLYSFGFFLSIGLFSWGGTWLVAEYFRKNNQAAPLVQVTLTPLLLINTNTISNTEQVETLSVSLLPTEHVTPSSTAFQAVSPSPAVFYAEIKIEKLYLRRGPDIQHPEFSSVYFSGTQMKILEKYDNWFYVEAPDGTRGWLYFGWVDFNHTMLDLIPTPSVVPSTPEPPYPNH